MGDFQSRQKSYEKDNSVSAFACMLFLSRGVYRRPWDLHGRGLTSCACIGAFPYAGGRGRGTDWGWSFVGCYGRRICLRKSQLHRHCGWQGLEQPSQRGQWQYPPGYFFSFFYLSSKDGFEIKSGTSIDDTTRNGDTNGIGSRFARYKRAMRSIVWCGCGLLLFPGSLAIIVRSRQILIVKGSRGFSLLKRNRWFLCNHTKRHTYFLLINHGVCFLKGRRKWPKETKNKKKCVNSDVGGVWTFARLCCCVKSTGLGIKLCNKRR